MNEESAGARSEGGGPTRFDRAADIFHEARSLSPLARDELIAMRCAGDPELAKLVQLLIRGDAAPLPAEAMAEQIRAAGEVVAASTTADLLTTRIGGYKLLERLGEGGFGVVYLAEQEYPVRRRVALKVIKLGMDTKQVVARFEAERQALAIMDHPNIAKVFDGGATETGRPYFVMELVHGVPITEYCDRERLSLTARLELVVAVCDALQHAHQKGVIHRDIKPSNVLVGRSDSGPVPKIIDFGIAKATAARLTEKTIFTETRQMLGTPEYMSPEQSGSSAGDIDTRSDIYSTGVLLYELLSGATPFDSARLRSAAYGEIQRIIREEEPPKPSTRLSSLHASIEEIAARRAMVPAKLTTSLRGELDWIVMKAIEKERSRRYGSAGELGADLRRFLTGEAVLAAPSGTVYQFRKWVRRNRAAVLAVSAVTVTLVGGLIGTGIGLVRARDERERADLKASDALAAETEALRRLYAACMTTASDAVANFRAAEARVALEEAPEARRGWEWRHLVSRLDQSVIFRKGEFVDPVEQDSGNYALLPARDGHTYYIRNGWRQEGISRFDLRTGAATVRFVVKGLDLRISPLFYAPDGRVAAQVAEIPHDMTGPEVLLWDADNSGTVEHRVWDLRSELHQGERFWPVTINADLSRAFAMNTERMVVFDLDSRKVVASRKGVEAYRAMFDPLGRWVLYTNPRGTLVMLDAKTLEDYFALPGHANVLYRPSDQSFSADGTLLATAGGDGVIRLWDLNARPPVCRRELHHGARCWSAVISRDGRYIVSAAGDRTVCVWDANSGRQLAKFTQEGLVADTLAIFPDSRTIGAVCEDMGVVIWTVDQAESSIIRHSGTVYPAMFLPNQGLVVTGGWEGSNGRPDSLRISDADSGAPVGASLGPGRSVLAGAVSRDGRLFAIGIAATDELGSVRLGCQFEVRDSATGKLVFASPPTGLVPRAAAFDPSGQRLACCYDSRLFVYDIASGAQKEITPVPTGLQCVAWSGDGKYLALSSHGEYQGPPWHKRIGLIDPNTGSVVRTFDGLLSNTVAFSADSTKLAAGFTDGRVMMWQVETGEVICELKSGEEPCYSVAFSPDGKRLAAGGADKVIRLWDTATFDMVAALPGHGAFVWSVVWDATGERLVSTSADGTARMWETSPIRTRVEAGKARGAAVAKVSPMVERLFAELQEADRVVLAIDADASLSVLERRVARQLVLARGLRESDAR
jgi:serine/threonine protein kinase/WD40 repeat protein